MRLAAGSSVRQHNAYLLSPYPDRDAAQHIQQVRHRLLNPLVVSADIPPKVAVPVTTAVQPCAGETTQTARLKAAIWEALARSATSNSTPSTPTSSTWATSMTSASAMGCVHILSTMPHRGRPVYQSSSPRAEAGPAKESRRLLKVPGVRDVVVDFTWHPAWTSARLTDQGARRSACRREHVAASYVVQPPQCRAFSPRILR